MASIHFGPGLRGPSGTADSKQATVGRLLAALHNKPGPLLSFLAGDHGGEDSCGAREPGAGDKGPQNGMRGKCTG